MRTLCYILAVLAMAVGLEAAPAVLDFSRSHTMEDVRRSGLNFKRLSDFGHSVAYVYQEDRDIVVLLPGGRKISQRITIAHLNEKDGVLTRLELLGLIMPQDQAYQVAGTFCDSFNLSHDKLDAWYQLNLGKKYDTEELYLGSEKKYYPAVGINLFTSFNRYYPWTIRFHIRWNWTEHRGKDEEQAWREFPTPSIPEISLNPPSGLKYDGAAAYRADRDAAYDQAKKAKGSQAKGAGVVAASPGTHWWLWAFGFAWLSLLALLWFVIRKFGSKR